MDAGREQEDLKAAKAAARATASTVRAAACAAGGTLAARAVADHVLQFLAERKGRIAGYWSTGTELDCRPLLEDLAAAGREVALPVVLTPAAPLGFRAWRPGLGLVAGRYGIAVPPEGEAMIEPDIVLVPLLAFDSRYHRLGYGGGFYDRTLAQLRGRRPILAIGLAYAMQEMPSLPAASFDQPLDAVATELGVRGNQIG